MKIVVDELPITHEDCLFSESFSMLTNQRHCGIDGRHCAGDRCNKLVALNDILVDDLTKTRKE